MIRKLGKARTISRKLSLVASLIGALALVGGASAEDLPDLVVSDIVLAPPPQGYEDQEVLFIGAVIGNRGADCDKAISVACNFSCRGDSRRYVGGMRLKSLAGGKEVVVGERSPLDLSDCFFASRRKFTCTVDDNEQIQEADESNNTMTKALLARRPGA